MDRDGAIIGCDIDIERNSTAGRSGSLRSTHVISPGEYQPETQSRSRQGAMERSHMALKQSRKGDRIMNESLKRWRDLRGPVNND